MKIQLILSILIYFSLSTQAVKLTTAEQAKLNRVQLSNTIVFDKSDSLNLRIAKATKCVPTKNQLAWQSLEFTFFIHFGINTFTGREWGNGKESPSLFNPSKVDTDQWCRLAKEAGAKMMMITVKHHDGFCTWQTKYNDAFSVKSSPWKGGKGDVFRQLTDSCKKYGLKVGVYLSPADLYQIENKAGLYGNRSKYRESVIPTDPASFTSNPMKQRSVPKGFPVFKYKVDDYNRYMLNQLYELLTEYGPIHEVWFDGATPKSKGGQKYTRKIWLEMINALAPEAVIAIKGPDVRWCGNEHGGSRRSEWSPVAIKGKPEDWTWGDMKPQDLGSRKLLAKAGFVHWYPSETDVSIRHGWFWRNEKQGLRDVDRLFDIYERSVGGNSLLLLNVPPNREGVFAARDVATLKTLGARIKAAYGKPAATLTKNKNVYTLDKPTKINRCVIMEDIATQGQRVEEIALDAWVNGNWKEVATATTVGYKRILRFPEITTPKIRIRIEKERMPTQLKSVSVHYDLAPLRAPKITRSRNGTVNISAVAAIHYTTDGTTPTLASARFEKPFKLPDGGTVKAITVRDKAASEVSEARFDKIKIKWRVVKTTSETKRESGARAIDDNPNSVWRSFIKKKTPPMPHQITIDFNEALNLKGFTYLPSTKRWYGGVVQNYKLEVSKDGKKWTTAAEGRFDNIANNPVLQEILFEKTYKQIRYIRFSALQSTRKNQKYCTVAELGVITH